MLAVFAELEAKELGRWILRILKRSRDLQEALGVLVRTSPDSSQSAFASAYPIFSTLRRREWLKTKCSLEDHRRCSWPMATNKRRRMHQRRTACGCSSSTSSAAFPAMTLDTAVIGRLSSGHEARGIRVVRSSGADARLHAGRHLAPPPLRLGHDHL